MARRRQPSWARGVYVELFSADRLDLAMREADDGKGVSANELAKSIGLGGHSYIARLRRGQAKGVQPHVADAMCKRLGVERKWLFLTVPKVQPVGRDKAA